MRNDKEYTIKKALMESEFFVSAARKIDQNRFLETSLLELIESRLLVVVICLRDNPHNYRMTIAKHGGRECGYWSWALVELADISERGFKVQEGTLRSWFARLARRISQPAGFTC